MSKEKEKIKKTVSKKLHRDKEPALSGGKNLKDKKWDLKADPLSKEGQTDKIKSFWKKNKRPEAVHKNGLSSHSLKEKTKSEETGEASHLSDDDRASFNEKLKQALADNLYLRAEFENFKRRSAEERRQLIRYSGERLICSLANEVLDDLDRAMLSAEKEKSFKNLKKGLDMITTKLSQVLNSFGVKVVDPTGQAFDPSYQEALSHIKTSQFPEDHVAETFKKAYKLHDKVIRPAQVVLAKKEEKED